MKNLSQYDLGCHLVDGKDLDEYTTEIKGVTDGQLLGQELVQRGAIHALNTLLRIGFTRKNCSEMLDSLSRMEQVMRDEKIRRGLQPAFRTQVTEPGESGEEAQND